MSRPRGDSLIDDAANTGLETVHLDAPLISHTAHGGLVSTTASTTTTPLTSAPANEVALATVTPEHPLSVDPSAKGDTSGICVDSKPLLGTRILFVVNVDWFFLSHRLPLALGAQNAGAEVWVACVDTGLSDVIRSHGLHFEPLRMSRNGWHAGEELRTLLGLMKLYRAVAPDLIHHVTIKPVLYGSCVAQLYRTPAVNAISGFGHLFRAGQRRFPRFLAERAYRLALHSRRSVTIFQNEEDRDEFVSHRIVEGSRAELIRGSGVDCTVFLPAAHPPTNLLVMFASRMLKDKGVEDFVAAAEKVRRVFPDARLVLIGEPDDSPSSVNLAQLQDWHRSGLVEWWGHRADMQEVLQQATIVVLPTYYREGLPKILLEAAACGIPMITTDVPGCRDIVRHRRTGLLVKPHNVNQLSDAIIELLGDTNLRRQLGDAARAFAEQDFNVTSVVTATLRIYGSLLPS